MRSETKRFLELMEQRNQAIFEREEAKKRATHLVDPDLFRQRRDQERRDKYGQLRARAKPNNRPNKVRHLYGFSDLSQND